MYVKFKLASIPLRIVLGIGFILIYNNAPNIHGDGDGYYILDYNKKQIVELLTEVNGSKSNHKKEC